MSNINEKLNSKTYHIKRNIHTHDSEKTNHMNRDWDRERVWTEAVEQNSNKMLVKRKIIIG